jgi:protein-L-isoaspartate(D-aspartate) O-methyltransferase
MGGDFDFVGIGMTSQRTRNRLIERLREKGIRSEAVLEVLGQVPRHIFVDEALAQRAYEDTALPIGSNQTISQPFIVALMTEHLLNVPRERVLEIGTGSGYQTAVLSKLVRRVYTIERIASLMDRAKERFRALRLRNIHTKYADGNLGWPEQAPFDAILVTAGARTVPQALQEQLAVGGRMVIPVGQDSAQELRVIDRVDDGFRETSIESVRFVPLLRGTSD